MTRIKSKEDLIFRNRPNFPKKNKYGIYVLLRSINFKKAFFEHYAIKGTLSFKECLTLIKKHFRPKQNNYEVYKQAIKDLRKTYTIKLNNPSIKLRMGWDKKNKAIHISIKQFKN
jgi:plasmid maintenance system killer protein